MSAMDIFDTCHDPRWDFVGPNTFSATDADNSSFDIVILGTTPTVALGNTGNDIGAVTLTLTSTSEAQSASIFQSDLLQFDIDDLIRFECRVKMGQATLDANGTFSFGLISARNATYTSPTALAVFSILGSASTTLVRFETDDNVTDTAPVSTGKTLVAAYKTFAIDFSNGKSDVRAYVDGQPVCLGTTFTMGGYSSGLQVYAMLQKASGTGVDAATIDYFRVICRRPGTR